MKVKYSREKFDGYTYRFIVVFKVEGMLDTNLTIYSNSDSYLNLEDFIELKKSSKVRDFEIIYRCTKEQDEIATQMIEETLKDW